MHDTTREDWKRIGDAWKSKDNHPLRKAQERPNGPSFVVAKLPANQCWVVLFGSGPVEERQILAIDDQRFFETKAEAELALARIEGGSQ